MSGIVFARTRTYKGFEDKSEGTDKKGGGKT